MTPERQLVSIQAPSGKLALLIERAQSAMLEVDYSVMEILAEASASALHRAAALAKMAAHKEAFDVRIAEARLKFGWDPNLRGRFENSPELAKSYRIELEEFVGAGYDLVGQRVSSPPCYAERTHNDRLGIQRGVTDGYVQAFFCPVHGPLITFDELCALFAEINDCLFGGLSDDLVIFSWSNDWSDYFVPGNEWWGAHLWTIERQGSGQIVVIAASATD